MVTRRRGGRVRRDWRRLAREMPRIIDRHGELWRARNRPGGLGHSLGYYRRNLLEYEALLGSDIAVAIVDESGNEIVDLRDEWLPKNIYGEEDYAQRITELSRRRFYGQSSEDKAGILRYTKVLNGLYDLSDIPVPANERELTWLLSFFWNVDQARDTLADLDAHRGEGNAPDSAVSQELQDMYERAISSGLSLSVGSATTLKSLGIRAS